MGVPKIIREPLAKRAEAYEKGGKLLAKCTKYLRNQEGYFEERKTSDRQKVLNAIEGYWTVSKKSELPSTEHFTDTKKILEHGLKIYSRDDYVRTLHQLADELDATAKTFGEKRNAFKSLASGKLP